MSTKGWQCSRGTMNRCPFQNHMWVGLNLQGHLPLHSSQSWYHPAWHPWMPNMEGWMTIATAGGEVFYNTFVLKFLFFNTSRNHKMKESVQLHFCTFWALGEKNNSGPLLTTQYIYLRWTSAIMIYSKKVNHTKSKSMCNISCVFVLRFDWVMTPWRSTIINTKCGNLVPRILKFPSRHIKYVQITSYD